MFTIGRNIDRKKDSRTRAGSEGQLLRAFISLSLALIATALFATSAYAHGFGQRYDLPIPLDYFLIGAVAAVALSFVVLGAFVRRTHSDFGYPRLNLLRLPVVGSTLRSPYTSFTIRAVSVGIFLLLLATGFAGTNRPIENLSPVFVWIIWWVGMGYIAALFGNLWMYVNPFRITFEWYRALRGHGDEPEEPPFQYPKWLDAWPALLFFFVFAWAENVYTDAQRPMTLAVMVSLYSLITWAGMAAFGKHVWLRNAEAFTVLFGIFARFSPTEIRARDRRICRRCSSDCGGESECVDCHECFELSSDSERELNLRPYAVGLVLPTRISLAAAAFVVFALATVTYDGLQDTQAWSSLRTELTSVTSVDVIDTAALAAAPLAFAALYIVFCWGVRTASGDEASVGGVARGFVFSLVPIALAYNLAHFITLLLIEGQLIIALLSDPFGYGWNLFGTADYSIQRGVITAKAVWFISLAAIVIGHVVSVYIAHAIALRRSADSAAAMRGQLPMLTLMALYTASSLWIIAQPLVG